LRGVVTATTMGHFEPLISLQDVTTIMRLLDEIQQDVHGIRDLLDDDHGEEEAPEADG
jgi:hypothetical protein